MKMKICLVMILMALSLQSFAQTPERRSTNSQPPAPEQSATLQPNGSAIETVAKELEQLRKSLQTLNARLREISDKLLAPDTNQSGSPKESQNRISLSLDLLSRAEQRAEVLRRQLLELIEKETAVKNRLVQIEEEIRPENIERALNVVGTTRSLELREVRRRVLENERKGYESLLNQTFQSRVRLEDDVKQADALVAKLRQRVLPLIEKEIEKLNPN
jgi:DNA repair exonuclease SbcCD ATPase subunit